MSSQQPPLGPSAHGVDAQNETLSPELEEGEDGTSRGQDSCTELHVQESSVPEVLYTPRDTTTRFSRELLLSLRHVERAPDLFLSFCRLQVVTVYEAAH